MTTWKHWTEAVSERDPVELFGEWLKDAELRETNDANAVALATMDRHGIPNVRMVLLKSFDARGFVFYTNLGSEKGIEIEATRKLAMSFYWKSLQRQVLLRGSAEHVAPEDADAYFNSRDRKSRIGAWTSKQSEPLATKRELFIRIAYFTVKFCVGRIPRPEHWSGIRLVPASIEFSQERSGGINSLKFVRSDQGWKSLSSTANLPGRNYARE